METSVSGEACPTPKKHRTIPLGFRGLWGLGGFGGFGGFRGVWGVCFFCSVMFRVFGV